MLQHPQALTRGYVLREDTAAVQRQNTDEDISDVGLISLQPVMEFSIFIVKQVSEVDISG